MPILSGLAFQPIAYDVPNTGAKSISTGVLTWAGQTSYLFDSTQNNQVLEMQNLQSVYVDNSQTSGSTTITVAGSLQPVTVPAYTQGWFTLLTGDRPMVTITNSSGAGSSQLWFTNFPCSPMLWSAQAALMFSGNVQRPQLVGNLMGYYSLSGGGGNLAGIVGAPGYYITGLTMQPSSDATIAVAGDFTASLYDSSSGQGFTGAWNLPASGKGFYPPISTPSGFIWNNKTAASFAQVFFNVALVTGALRVTVSYGLANFVG